ncbi:MAG: DUF1080 domain-containing protein [Rhodopirellula sp.]|nr:DUF1080 domain-containing protein [Rhodopirellula sp.]
MNRSLLMIAAFVTSSLMASVSLAADAAQNVPPKGFTALFNGKDLSGWRGLGHFSPYKLAEMSEEDRAAMWKKNQEDVVQHWTVEDGELVNDGHGVYLTTEKEYSNFEFWIDYKTVAKADSGIYLKFTPQVQIWDYTEEGGKWNLDADKGSGGLWNNSKGAPGKNPSVLADKPFGEWNRFRIRQIGARTWVWLNDKLVVEDAVMENFWKRDAPLLPKGSIQLQTHGGEIRWRNIFIREIGQDEAAKTLANSDEGFESVFDGKSFEGWAGPTDNYEVVDGAVRCKQGKGGTIYYNENLTDFVARLEFKVPPGGNNGLAIRYPGSGDTAYVGLCELQVLDNTAEKYAKLDPRQYHGSVYGVVAAQRGYQRPVGEWNYQEVTVKGSWVKVELNGTVIVDADVTKPEEHMGGKRHVGIDRVDGYFGFAGHGDAVEFRNIRLKKLAPANPTPAENKPAAEKAK